jgi:hypothetical protein
VRHGANRAIERLREDAFVPEAVQRSIALIEGSLPLLDVELWEALMEARLCFVRLSCKALAGVGWCFRTPSPFEVIQLGPCSGLVKTGTAEAVHQIGPRVQERMQSRGCANVEDIAADVQQMFGTNASARFTEAAIRCAGRFEWLDQEGKWFWYMPEREAGSNRLVHQIQRVLAATPRIELRKLRSAIRRDNGGLAPPSKVLEAVCRRLLFVKIEGDSVARAVAIASWDTILGAPEKILVDVLRSQQSVLPREALWEQCRQRGLDEHAFDRLLADSLHVHENDGGYALVGTTFPTKPAETPEIAAMDSNSTRSAYGFLSEGQIFVAWTVQSLELKSGVLRMPEPINTLAEGDYKLKTAANRELGPLHIRQRACWDVRRLLIALAGEAEDTLVIVLDLRDHTAIGVVGGDDAVARLLSGGLELAATNAERTVRDSQEPGKAPALRLVEGSDNQEPPAASPPAGQTS